MFSFEPPVGKLQAVHHEVAMMKVGLLACQRDDLVHLSPLIEDRSNIKDVMCPLFLLHTLSSESVNK